MHRPSLIAAVLITITALALPLTSPAAPSKQNSQPTDMPYPAPLAATPTDYYPPIEPTWPPVGPTATPGPDATPPVMPPRDAFWYLPLIQR